MDRDKVFEDVELAKTKISHLLDEQEAIYLTLLEKYNCDESGKIFDYIVNGLGDINTVINKLIGE